MIEAFNMLASGTYSADEVRKWLNDNKLKISKNTFLRCIRNPVYIGKIRTGAWKKEPSQDVPGLHPALISSDGGILKCECQSEFEKTKQSAC